jgi:hypothetical protein
LTTAGRHDGLEVGSVDLFFDAPFPPLDEAIQTYRWLVESDVRAALPVIASSNPGCFPTGEWLGRVDAPRRATTRPRGSAGLGRVAGALRTRTNADLLALTP